MPHISSSITSRYKRDKNKKSNCNGIELRYSRKRDAKISSVAVGGSLPPWRIIYVYCGDWGKKVRVTERRDVTRTGSVADARPFLAVWPPWRPREPSSWFSDSSTPSSSSAEESGSLEDHVAVTGSILMGQVNRAINPRDRTAPGRGSMKGRIVKRDGNFAERMSDGRDDGFRIRERFVIDRLVDNGCRTVCFAGDRRSVVHRRQRRAVRHYEQRPWRGKKKMLPC